MSQDDRAEKQDHRDFFISYTGRDRQWAEWIAFQLERAGYTLFIQAWDFQPGTNFVAEMDRAAKRAEQTLLVLSPAYLESDYAFAEWAAAFRHDPKGTGRKLLPVRIELCEVDGLLGPIVFIDLVSLGEMQARSRLLAGVQQERAKPATVTFPGISREAPVAIPFPGVLPAPESLAAALNRHRPATPRLRKLNGEQEAHLIALVCSQPQEGTERWTLQLLADKLVEPRLVESISRETVRQVLHTNELKPWLKEQWYLPPKGSAEFIC